MLAKAVPIITRGWKKAAIAELLGETTSIPDDPFDDSIDCLTLALDISYVTYTLTIMSVPLYRTYNYDP